MEPKKASVQIKTSNGSTLNINNVDPNYIFTAIVIPMPPDKLHFTIKINNIDYVKN
jgi:hypothetical protein